MTGWELVAAGIGPLLGAWLPARSQRANRRPPAPPTAGGDDAALTGAAAFRRQAILAAIDQLDDHDDHTRHALRQAKLYDDIATHAGDTAERLAAQAALEDLWYGFAGARNPADPRFRSSG